MYSTCVSSKLCEFILFDLSNFPLLGISSHLLQRWLGLLCSSCAAGRFLPRLLCNSFHWKLLPSGHCLVSSLCFPEEMMFLACLTLSVSTSLKCSLYSALPEWIAPVFLLLLCTALGLHHIWWETPLVRTGSRDPWQLLNAMGKMQIRVLAVLRKHLEILPKSGLGFLSSAATTNISCSLASNKGEYKEHLSLKLPILALLTICERLALVAGNPSTLLCYISRSSGYQNTAQGGDPLYAEISKGQFSWTGGARWAVWELRGCSTGGWEESELGGASLHLQLYRLPGRP